MRMIDRKCFGSRPADNYVDSRFPLALLPYPSINDSTMISTTRASLARFQPSSFPIIRGMHVHRRYILVGFHFPRFIHIDIILIGCSMRQDDPELNGLLLRLDRITLITCRQHFSRYYRATSRVTIAGVITEISNFSNVGLIAPRRISRV